MIERKKIFKTVVDKIDYDHFVELINEHKPAYSVLRRDEEVFNSCFNKNIEFNLDLNKDAELYLILDKDKKGFINIVVDLTKDNIITSFFKGNFTKDEFKLKLKQQVDETIAIEISKLKHKILEIKKNDIIDIFSCGKYLMYLLDNDYFIDKVRSGCDCLYNDNDFKRMISKYATDNDIIYRLVDENNRPLSTIYRKQDDNTFFPVLNGYIFFKQITISNKEYILVYQNI